MIGRNTVRCWLLAALALATASIADAAAWRDDWRDGVSSRGIARDASIAGGTLVVVGDRAGGSQGFVSGFDIATGVRGFARAGLTQGVVAPELVVQRLGGGWYVSGQRTYSSETYGFVSRYDASGVRSWTVEFVSDRTPVVVSVAPDRLVVATRVDSTPRTARLALLSDADGVALHQRALSGASFGTIGAFGGDVYAAIEDGTGSLERFDGTTLARRWRTTPPNVTELGAFDFDVSQGLVASAVVAGRNALVGFDVPTGSEQWRTVSQRDGFFTAGHTLVAVGAAGGWLLGGDDGASRVFRGGPGLPVAADETDLPLSGLDLTRDANTLYVAGERDSDGRGGLLAFDIGAGAIAWQVDRPPLSDAVLAAGSGRVAFLQKRYELLPDAVVAEVLDRQTGSTSVPAQAFAIGPLQGAAVPGTAGAVFASAATVDDGGASMYVRSYHASGAVRWEKRFDLTFAQIDRVEPAQIAIAENGAVLAWTSGWRESAPALVDAYGSWRLVCLDPDTGEMRWEVGESSSGGTDRPFVAGVATGAGNSVYVASGVEFNNGDVPGYAHRIRRLNLPNGVQFWSRNVNTAPAMLAVPIGVIVSGESVAPGVSGLALYGAFGGATTWSRPSTGFSPALFSRLRLLPDGDVLAAYDTNPPVPPNGLRDIRVERFAPLDGAQRWVQDLGVGNGAQDTVRSLFATSDGALYLSGRHGNSTIGTPFVVRFDPASGAPLWETPLVSGWPGSFGSHLMLAPSGELLVDVRTNRQLSDGDCAVCQSHLVRLQQADGAVAGWHHLGTEVARNYVEGEVAVVAEANSGELVLNSPAHVEGEASFMVSGRSLPVFLPGAATVTVAPGRSFDPVDGAERGEFVLRVSHDAGSPVNGIFVQARTTIGSVVSDVRCVVTGGAGHCHPARVDAALGIRVELAPGATAEITAQLQLPPTSPAPFFVEAVATMPIEYGAPSPQSAHVSATIPIVTLLSNGFE